MSSEHCWLPPSWVKKKEKIHYNANVSLFLAIQVPRISSLLGAVAVSPFLLLVLVELGFLVLYGGLDGVGGSEEWQQTRK